MKKILIILILCAVIMIIPVGAESVFTDIEPGAWYEEDVSDAVSLGLINGVGEGRFSPDTNLTRAAALKLAVALNLKLTQREITINQPEGRHWYLPYLLLAKSSGIISTINGDWEGFATRGECMKMFWKAIPDSDLDMINEIPYDSIPDLNADTQAEVYDAIYDMYRAGITQGGEAHESNEKLNIRRCEIAAILSRIMHEEKRIRFEIRKHKIETIDGITYVDGILIVNKTYSLPDTYNPGGLTDECRTALNQMYSDARNIYGISLWSVSEFRSYDRQYQLYNNYVARDGKAEADRYSARPGHSEHQTGLAVDVNSVDYSFAYTPEGIWLKDHCHEYGFIIRYPEGKEEITGYMYEPWHVRYLGKETAEKVHESGLTLEEYLEITCQLLGD